MNKNRYYEKIKNYSSYNCWKQKMKNMMNVTDIKKQKWMMKKKEGNDVNELFKMIEQKLLILKPENEEYK